MEMYFETLKTSRFDWFILVLAGLFALSQLSVACGYCLSHKKTFIQDLPKWREFFLLVIELLPILGILGTVLGLGDAMRQFDVQTQGEQPNLSAVISRFAPALSTTISGLIGISLNLPLNTILRALETSEHSGGAE